MARAFGIDLGTSRTKISCLDSDVSETQPLAIEIGGQPLVPSKVLFENDVDSPQIKVGWQIDTDTNDPRVISSVKLHMGKSEAELRAQTQWHGPPLPVDFNGKAYGPTEISSEILKYVVAEAHKRDFNAREVVVTVPAEFSFRQREATVEAIRGAGLELRMLLSEPIAALLAYLAGKKVENLRALVFDLGGGTLDCTVIEIASGVSQVRSKTGGIGIAGDHIDDLLYEYLKKSFDLPEAVEMDTREKRLHRQSETILFRRCRTVKEGLSESDVERFDASNLYLAGQVFDLQRDMTRTEFEVILAPLTRLYQGHIDNALREAGLSVGQIDLVLMVGGSTRIPIVREAVKQIFGDKVHNASKPDLFVSFGAALASYQISKGERVIDDTLAQSVGKRSAVSFDYELLLQRNTPLREASHTEVSLWPAGADSVAIDLYEGADGVKTIHDKADSGPLCQYIGSYELRAAPKPAQGAKLEITYRCNPTTTLLEVSGRLQQGGGQIVVVRHNTPPNLQGLSAEKNARLDVMVLLDTTGSMRFGDWNGLKNQLREGMMRMWDSKVARAGQLDMRAALTLFGDARGDGTSPGDPIQTLPFTSRSRDFCTGYIAQIDHFATEGGDDPESCYDALWRATSAGIRADEKTLRVFVLISDGGQSAPPSGNASIPEIVSELQKRGIQIYAITPYHSDYAHLCEQTGGAHLEFDDAPLAQHFLTLWRAVGERLNAMVR